MATRRERIDDLFLPVIAEAHQVAAFDPEQADIAVGHCFLEADADLAVFVKQREVAVREVVVLRTADGLRDAGQDGQIRAIINVREVPCGDQSVTEAERIWI